MMSPREETLMPDAGSDDGDRVSWSGIAYTVLLLALITTALHIDSLLMSSAVVASAAAVTGVVHRCLPESPILPLVLANAIGVYACAFVFVVEILFPETGDLAAFASYLIPLVGFTAGLLLNRDRSRSSDTGIDGGAIWCGLSIALIASSLALLHVDGFDDFLPTFALFGFAIGLGGVAYLSSQTIADFMTETGDLFRDFFATIRELVRPAYAFFTFYLLFVIVFASLYSIIDYVSMAPHFSIQGELRDIRFLEAIYFSLITFSTVGYGDMTPVSHAARIVVTIQVLTGVVLTLFGFFAIMNYRTEDK
ncbi:MAG: potassium channel family protein [Geminicoccaceae bacterium]